MLSWRRDRPQWSWLAVGVLAFLALGGIGGGISDTDAGSIVFGIACVAGAVAVFLWRRPGTVTVRFVPSVRAGTEVTVEGDDAPQVTEMMRVAIGATTAQQPPPSTSGWLPPTAG